MTTLEVAMDILLPFITAIIIDRGLEQANLPTVYRYGALMVVMAFLGLVFAALAGQGGSQSFVRTGGQPAGGHLPQHSDLFLFQHR